MAQAHKFSQVEYSHFGSIQFDVPRPAPPNTSFLFVVKTPDSGVLSRSSSRSAAASINSHAQRWAQEIGTVKENQPLHNAAAPGVNSDLRFESCVTRCRLDRLGISEGKASKSKRSTAVSGATASPKLLPVQKLKSIASSESPTAVSSKKLKSSRQAISRLPATCASKLDQMSPTDPTFGLSSAPPILDYIRMSPLSLDGNAQLVLQYYLSFVLLSTADASHRTTPLDSSLNKHSSTIKAIVQGCLQEDIHLYALLAATASRMKRVSGVQFAADHGPESYLSKAIQCLRALLTVETASSDRQIILDIYYLSVCEWYLGSYDAANTHFTFLKHLLKSLPQGFSEFDQYVADMLSYDDCWLRPSPVRSRLNSASSTSPSPSTFRSSMLSYRKLPPKPSHHEKMAAEACCSAFDLALQGPTYSQDLRGIIQELPPICNLFRSFNRHTPEEANGTSLVPNKVVASYTELAQRLLENPSYGNELCCRLALVLILRYMVRGAIETNYDTQSTESTMALQRLRRQLQYEILLPSNEISLSSKQIWASGNIQPASKQDGPPHFPASSLSSPLSTPKSPTTPSSRPHSKIWTGHSNELLLWILVTGLFAARQQSTSSLNSNKDDIDSDDGEEVHWFGTRAMALIQFLDIKSHDRLTDMMVSFFCVDEMLYDDILIRSWPA
ncbi:hypothetical protein LTR84_004874 [Exophiala bonariae]|uniref:Transcription factor domain-containing protein n=1 Tax=Exophiala bonariae TaxID=1690606 RepID=A0AAV9NNF7_9EURO|nr:hypothetical protein LTR84_004874 [Exophiala bonariae]